MGCDETKWIRLLREGRQKLGSLLHLNGGAEKYKIEKQTDEELSDSNIHERKIGKKVGGKSLNVLQVPFYQVNNFPLEYLVWAPREIVKKQKTQIFP